MVHDRLGQHGERGKLGGIDAGIAGSVTDGEKFLSVRAARAELIVLFAIEGLERPQLAIAGTPSCQRADDESGAVGECRASFAHGPLGQGPRGLDVLGIVEQDQGLERSCRRQALDGDRLPGWWRRR